jgi:hypothetical protein
MGPNSAISVVEFHRRPPRRGLCLKYFTGMTAGALRLRRREMFLLSPLDLLQIPVDTVVRYGILATSDSIWEHAWLIRFSLKSG